MNDSRLIFIISLPRSGSTLLQALLSNNDKVDTASEPWLLLPFLSYSNPEVANGKFNSKLACDAIAQFTEKLGDANVLKDKLKQVFLDVYGLLQSEEGNFVLDKTPRYYEIIDEIYSVFPNAKFIFLKRNPFSTLNSIIDTWTKGNSTFQRLDALLPYHRDLLNGVKCIHDACLKYGEKANVKIVKYEDLVVDSSVQMEVLYRWLGIDFNEKSLDYGRNEKFKGMYGDPTGIKKKSSPTSESLEKWKEKFQDPLWSKFFEGYANHLSFLDSYGYENIRGHSSNIYFQYYLYQVRLLTSRRVGLKEIIRFKMFRRFPKLRLLFKY